MLGKPKPALTTYRDVLYKEFADVKDIKPEIHGHAGVGFLEGNSPFKPSLANRAMTAFEFHTAGGRRVLMAFADTDKAIIAQLPAHAARATAIDRHNRRWELKSEHAFGEDLYFVELKGATSTGGWPTANDAAAKAMGLPEHLVGGATVVIVEDK